MSLAMYASPYDNSILSDEYEINDKRVKRTTRPKTQKKYIPTEKVAGVLQSINEDDNLADFSVDTIVSQPPPPPPPKKEHDEVDIEEIKKFNGQFSNNGLTNYFKNTIPYNELNFNGYKPPSTGSATGSNTELVNKLNYVIGLLENQQDEKTNNVTEDLIIYALLGVFIIFVIDKFVNVGKYVR